MDDETERPVFAAGDSVQVLLNGWASIVAVPAEVVGVTPHRYRVRFSASGYRVRAGEVRLVPKHAVIELREKGAG